MVRRGTSSKARLPDTVADDRRFPSSVQVPLGSLLGPEGTRILSCAARRVENTEALSSPAVGSEKPRQAAKICRSCVEAEERGCSAAVTRNTLVRTTRETQPVPRSGVTPELPDSLCTKASDSDGILDPREAGV
ncbi:hypothetical protein GN956_G6411 [Arapaima gigas]